MAQKRPGDDTFINSIVGTGTFFRGHLELSGLLRIDGDFSGSVLTDGRVIVGQQGRADCAIEASTVVVGGVFRGEILAYEKVVLLSSSIVVGSITAPRLIVEEGVLLSCRLNVSGARRDRQPESTVSEKRKELLIESIRQRETSRAVAKQSETAQRRSSSARTTVEKSGNPTWSA